jgi:hypothetical protein
VHQVLCITSYGSASTFNHYLLSTDMARQSFQAPLGTVRWCHLITARKQYDETKPPAFSTELLLPNADPATKKFIKDMEAYFIEQHGAKAKRSQYAFPWGPDKDQPDVLTVVKFKQAQFTDKNTGEAKPGPRIIDSQCNPWDGSIIGNGSKLLLKFQVYAWEGAAGCGLSFQPTAAQVVEFVPYERSDDAASFAPVAGGYVAAAAGLFEDDSSEVEF